MSHPTQGLLDALTVRQHKKQFEGLAIAIVGDIRHSRVARSAFHDFERLGVKDLRIVAPESLMPEDRNSRGVPVIRRSKTGLKDVDVVMMLRIQKRAHGAGGPAGCGPLFRQVRADA